MWLLLFWLLPQAQAADVSGADKRNLVIIAMDAVQARRTSLLGHKPKTTPTLSKLAEKAYVFEQAISPASWTVPAYLSIFSSLHPSQHGLTNRYREYSKSKQVLNTFKDRQPEILTLAQVLKAQGLRTGGFTGDSGVSAVLGYDKGFEKYTDDVKFAGLDTSIPKAKAWLDTVKADERFFMFVHGYDSHGQYPLPKDFTGKFALGKYKGPFKGTAEEQGHIREKLLAGEEVKVTRADIDFWRAWYDSKIHDADARVGELLKHLEASGKLANTVIVVLADHGTEFFEHGRVDHGHTLYDELVHVPLLILNPSVKGRRIKEQVSTLDLMPTLLALMGIRPSPELKTQMRGQDLSGLMIGKDKGHDVFSETDYRGYTHKRSLRTADGWKYIMTFENGKEELYNLKQDPGETKNLAGGKGAEKLKELKARLMAHLDQLPPAPTATGCLPVYQGQCEPSQ